MPEAMQKIRKDLGIHAVILQSKEVKSGGFLGLFKKKNIEVIAGVDPNPIQTSEKKIEKKNVPTKVETVPPTNENDKILTEIQQLKKMIDLQQGEQLDDNRQEFQLALHHLLDQEVEETVAKEIINAVIKKRKKDEVLSYERVMSTVGDYIEEKLKPFHLSSLTQNKVIQFVGPTGVGKTTTIAKIAATLMLKKSKKVAFITTDTYRIAAIEQLKTYARILDVPLEVAYSFEDFKKAIKKLNDYDVILVDTAGRNFRESKYVQSLKKMIDNGVDMDTYLVLALTAKPKDIQHTFDQFDSLSKKSIIFTKADETAQYGSLINIPFTRNIDIAFLTNGQDVPDDLIVCDAKMIRDLIIGDARE